MDAARAIFGFNNLKRKINRCASASRNSNNWWGIRLLLGRHLATSENKTLSSGSALASPPTKTPEAKHV